MMLFSPIIDEFVENCESRHTLVTTFVTIAALQWGWNFCATVEPMARWMPDVKGFGEMSAVSLLLVYVLARLIKRIGWLDWLGQHIAVTSIVFVVNGAMVAVGFRHMFGFPAFAFALCGLLLMQRIHIGRRLDGFILLLAPSMFSVYLFHAPFGAAFAGWERSVYNTLGLPHAFCQFMLAVTIFVCCVILDAPRRLLIAAIHRFAKNITNH